jgi:hypothetical protein
MRRLHRESAGFAPAEEGVMCSCDFDGHAEFSSVSHPIARKPWRCEECGDAVELGQRYRKHVSKWEGDIVTHRCCLECESWLEALWTWQVYACGCSGVLYGGLWEAIAEFCEEHLGYDPANDEDERTPHPPEKYEDPITVAQRVRRERFGETVVMGGEP